MTDPLAPLVQALELSPDNVVLRAHVVKEFLKAQRYDQAGQFAAPLLESDERALGLLATARASWASGRVDLAKEQYQQAIDLDSAMVDEAFELEFVETKRLRVSPSGQMEGDAPKMGVPSQIPDVGFEDIGGMEELKEQIRMHVIYPIQRPEIYEAYGKKIGGGIMLYGPPGCGKTHLARATAGELKANFFYLALHEVLDMWVGNSEKNLAQLFNTARAAAPAVLFIDEVDAMGGKRGSMTSSHSRQMVSQFLTEMDGIVSDNSKLLILAATNEPWNVDSALRRPGRFDRVLFVPPPDRTARAEILKLQVRDRKVDSDIPWDTLAAKTDFFSGADLGQLVEQAMEKAVAEALRTGNMRPVTFNDFKVALKERKPSTMEWLRRSRSYVNFGNQDGTYNDLAQYLAKAKIR